MHLAARGEGGVALPIVGDFTKVYADGRQGYTAPTASCACSADDATTPTSARGHSVEGGIDERRIPDPPRAAGACGGKPTAAAGTASRRDRRDGKRPCIAPPFRQSGRGPNGHSRGGKRTFTARPGAVPTGRPQGGRGGGKENDIKTQRK